MWSTKRRCLCPATRPLVRPAVNCTSEHLPLAGKAMPAVLFVSAAHGSSCCKLLTSLQMSVSKVY